MQVNSVMEEVHRRTFSFVNKFFSDQTPGVVPENQSLFLQAAVPSANLLFADRSFKTDLIINTLQQQEEPAADATNLIEDHSWVSSTEERNDISYSPSVPKEMVQTFQINHVPGKLTQNQQV